MKKIIIALLLVLASFSAANSQSIRIGEGNVYYVGGDSNYFKFSKQGFFPFGLKTFGTSTFNGSGLFNSANLTVANGILGVTGTGYIAEGGTNINLIYGATNDSNYWRRKQTMDSLLLGSGLLLWKNGQIFSSSSLNVNSITTSSDTTADLVVTHTGKFNGSDLDWTGATHTGFNAVKISVDTITAPDETVNIYGGLNILSGGWSILGRTENNTITFSRHNTDGDLLGLTIGSTVTTISYWDSTSNTTTALKVGNGTITANDSALATRNWVLNNVTGGAGDTNTYAKIYNFNRFADSTVFSKPIWMNARGTDRPILYQQYTDAGTAPVAFFGPAGVNEANWGLNLKYVDGLHNYWNTSLNIDYITLNSYEYSWQHIPAGYGNASSQPDAWSLSGNTTPFVIDSGGNMGINGQFVSILKSKGQPKLGTSRANDIFDTTRYNIYGRNGKSFIDWKLGVGIETPVSTLHIFNKATPKQTVTYNSLTDLTIEDAGAYERAQIGLISPNGSLIAFGDSATYNKAYFQFVNSSSTLNVVSSVVNLSGTVQENGTALTSKYSQLSASNTFSGTTNTFSNKVVVGTGTSIRSATDGIISFTNNAETDFNRIQLGGTTSSFPSIKRSGAGIQIRLADDSGYGALTAASFTSGTPNGGTAGTWKLGIYKNDASSLVVSTTDYIQVDIGGTLYKLAVVN